MRDHAGPWLFILFGNWAAWSGSHLLGLLGLISVLYGAWVQHELLVLRRTEVAARPLTCPYGQVERDRCAARPAPDSPPRWAGDGRNVEL
jgi:hypothetical protein